MQTKLYLFLFSLLLLVGCSENETTKQPSAKADQPKAMTFQLQSPVDLYGDFFKDVQMARLYPDSKTFADSRPKFPAQEILTNYKKEKDKPDFKLKAFVENHFDVPKQNDSDFKTDITLTTSEHVESLWSVLTHKADQQKVGTLITLPKPYVVPGGRFREIYYWDSYFIMIGLQKSGKIEMIENMTDNFAYLIDTIGFIPNGNRTYYMGRSQPPFFSLVVNLLAKEKGDEALLKYLPQLQKEYNFWMNGQDKLTTAKAYRRVVKVDNNTIMNRYWDDHAAPRPESYREDVELAESIEDRPAEKVYRHLRSACESGWNFSSRWFSDEQYLASIHAADIIPVDQNSLLYFLEEQLSKAYAIKGDSVMSKTYQRQMENRERGILTYNWNEKTQFFNDYDYVLQKPTGIPSLAAMFPLYFNIATTDQAAEVKARIEKDFLKPGGVVTTLNNTGQQWDAPNGWAPLQWITIQGLRNYGYDNLANTIRDRWLALNEKVYKKTGKMVEKYNVEDMTLDAGGGEYPVQDGFGWSNGVYLGLKATTVIEE